MRVLIIDDDMEIRQIVRMMLNTDSFKLYEAGDGKEGMEIIKREREIDIVITDLIMPEKEGLEIIKELKRDYPNVKILAISGGGKINANEYLGMAKILGADLTLSKPFVKQQLLDAIDRLLE